MRIKNLYILQIPMVSYQEFDAAGKSLDIKESGYLFAQVVFEDRQVEVMRLNTERLGMQAINQLTNSHIKIPTSDFLDCLPDPVNEGLLLAFLEADEFAERFLYVGQDAAWQEELESASAKFKESTVDPYQKIAELSQCVIKKAPSEALEDVFQAHSEVVFSGDRDILTRLE